MRLSSAVLPIAIAVVTLAACNKPSSTPQTDGSAGAEASDSTPSGPTPEQVKAILATLPAPYNTADVVNGKAKFMQCAACHTNTEGGPNMTGPNLYGVFGRKIGSVAGYDYSDAVKAAGFTWDVAHLDTWISGPMAMIPGTKMSFFGLKDSKDRADLIAYLKVSTTPAK